MRLLGDGLLRLFPNHIKKAPEGAFSSDTKVVANYMFG